MCSVIDDVEDLIPQIQVETLFELCKKCKKGKPCILRGIDPLCSPCFLAYCTHKFRSTIGKSHKIKPGEVILIPFCGDSVTTALLHMIEEGLKETSHKRILFKPVLLYLHESFSYIKIENVKQMLLKMLSTGLPCYISSLEMVFHAECTSPVFKKIEKLDEGLSFLSSQNSIKFDSMFTDIQSLTSKEDILEHLRMSLIDKIAATIMCDKVFSEKSASDLTVQLLSSIALGRGSQIPDFMGFEDCRYKVPILRPLREFNSKELSFYNHFHNLDFFGLHTLTTKTEPQSSISRMTESFVTSLQDQFPSTVSTIFRTGDKVCSSLIESVDDDNKCSLCQSYIDTKVLDGASAIGALLLSEKLTDKSSSEENCINNENCSCKIQNQSVEIGDLLTQLCYGCQCVVKDMTKTENLPAMIINNLQKSANRKSLKGQIEEYLLPV